MEAARVFDFEPDDLDRPEDEPCTAEKAECTCPDFCERDHTNE